MDNNVQLKVNAINQLRLLRASTFKDKLCFLDEDIQNAQRAKATEFKVKTTSNKITIENNGQILEDPQCLFSIAESGWDDDIKETENPFGTGFFSNITVSNYIEIYSGNKHIIFDVDKMINTQNIDIEVKELDEYYDGFKIVLNNFDFNNVHRWDIEERVKLLGAYIHELDVYYNAELISKKDLTDGDNSVFQTKIIEDNFQGWVALCNNFGWNEKINIFYKGRLVTKFDKFSYVKGDIHINDKTLNLTSPDRKDIIRDNKLKDFEMLLKLYIEELCNDSLVSGDEEDIDRHANVISYYSNKMKVKNLIRFATFKSNNKNDIEYLKGISSAKLKNPSINNLKEYCLYLEKEKQQEKELSEISDNDKNENEITISVKTKSKPREAKGVIHHQGGWHGGSSGSYEESYTETPEIKEDELEDKRGELLVVNGEPTFWLSFGDVVQCEYKLNIAKHYNLKIIVARNKIEEELLKSMENTDNVLHISKLKEDIEINATLSNLELSVEEKRAEMILNMISKQILNQEENLFRIGDLMIVKNIKIEAIDESKEIIEDKVSLVADKESKKILVDRLLLDKNHLSNHLSEELELEDYKFILANLKNICNEIDLLSLGISEQKAFNIILEALGRAI